MPLGVSSDGFRAVASLGAGYFFGGDNKILVAQRYVLPDSWIQIENAGGLWLKTGIPRPDPATAAPGLHGILAEPAPNGFATDRSRNALFFAPVKQFPQTKSGEGQPKLFGHLGMMTILLTRYHDAAIFKYKVSDYL